MFAILIATLPARPSAVRLRIWRALKSLGCAALRDGAYLLPLSHADALEGLAREVVQHGGHASVLSLAPRHDAQRADLLAMFDRGPLFSEWRQGAQAAALEIAALPEPEARRRVRQTADALANLQRIDYFPGPASAQADAELARLRQAADRQFSGNEPVPRSGVVPLRKASAFRGKRWATRARPWADRLACAWLIRRFIDPGARFVWLDERLQLPRGAIGFDFDGAQFSHVGEWVSFEVLMNSFGLDTDPALQEIAGMVHFLDAGGIPVAQAAGLEAVLAGLRVLHADDDALVAAAGKVFDALHAAASGAPHNGSAPRP
jgi:hypothetical protein